MQRELTLAVCCLLVSGISLAADNQTRMLESVSAHIGEHTDQRAVTNSLYRQVRPHVQITNKKLKASSVNKRVRAYIAKKYTPVLLMNYSLLFQKMKSAYEHFSSCKKLQPFEFARDIKTALCTVHHRNNINVRYLINDHNQGWKETAEFVFHPAHHSLKLVAIDLKLKKGQKFHVEGL